MRDFLKQTPEMYEKIRHDILVAKGLIKPPAVAEEPAKA